MVDLFAERDPIELIQDGAMEALADTIGLRALGLGAAVIDVLDREVELVFMTFGCRKIRCRDRSARAIAGLSTPEGTCIGGPE